MAPSRRKLVSILAVLTFALLAEWMVALPPVAVANVGSGGSFMALAPKRIADTTTGSGFGSAGALGPGVTKSVKVTGVAGVPSAGVGAVVIDVAARSSSNSRAYVYPSDESRGLASLSLKSGDWDSTTVLVRPGSDGRVKLFNEAGSADANIDIQGYFTASSTASSTGGYVPVTPTRVLNSASGVGANGALTGGTSYNVALGGVGEIPDNATGVYVGVRVYDASGDGGLRIVPSDATPGSSTPSVLNYGPTASFDTGAALDLGPDGKVKLWASAGTSSYQAVLDVQGYFTAGADGASFHPISNRRVYDSAGDGPLAPGETRIINVMDRGGVPGDGTAGAAALAITVKDWTGPGSVSAFHGDRSDANGTASVAFGGSNSVARQSTSFVDFNGRGQIKVRNNSHSGDVAVLINAQGWFDSAPVEPEEEGIADPPAQVEVEPLPCAAGTTTCQPVMLKGTIDGAVTDVEVLALPSASEGPDAASDVDFQTVEIPTAQVLSDGTTFTVRVDPADVPASVVQPDGKVSLLAQVVTAAGQTELTSDVQAVHVEGSSSTVWADPATSTPVASSPSTQAAYSINQQGTAENHSVAVRDYDSAATTPEDEPALDSNGSTIAVAQTSETTVTPARVPRCVVTWLDYYQKFYSKKGITAPDRASASFHINSNFSKTYGGAVSFSATGGWKVDSNGSKTIAGVTEQTWSGMTETTRYHTEVQYRKRRWVCTGRKTKWRYVPWKETDGALSYASARPSFPKKWCAYSDSGSISRNKTDGKDYALSGGVNAAALNLSLYSKRTWEKTQSVKYEWTSGSQRQVCGTNDFFGLASTAGMKK